MQNKSFKHNFAIVCKEPKLKAKSLELSKELSIPVISDFPKPDEQYIAIIILDMKGLSLKGWGKEFAKQKPVQVNFSEGAVAHRRRFGGGRGQLIAKAVGLQPGINPLILDATAGLGRDSFVLASLGCTVLMMERSPIIAELLADGLYRGEHDSEIQDIVSRISLYKGDALNYISSIEDKNLPDVIYLDPMFPQREKSALVKKEMQIFHEIVGQDLDATELLRIALNKARYRVVVKRPYKAESIGKIEPSLKFKGESSRFDVYVIKSLSKYKK